MRVVGDVIRDGGDLRFAVDVDRKTNELALELSLTAQPKSTLAASIWCAWPI